MIESPTEALTHILRSVLKPDLGLFGAANQLPEQL